MFQFMKKHSRNKVYNLQRIFIMMDEKQKPNYIYIVVILILLALLFSVLFKALGNYSVYKERKIYFSQSDPRIQDWMSIKIISTNFNLSSQDIINEMNVNGRKINPHISLKRFCKEYERNCILLIERLNNRTRT